MHKLRSKQARFVLEYLKDLNATQAAIRAGYSAKGANSKGAQLSAIVSIRKAIDQGLAKIAAASELTAEKIIRELEEARDIALAADPPQTASAIRASELRGKHIGMFPTKVENTGKGGGPIDVNIHGDPTPEEIDAGLARLGYVKQAKP